MTWELIFVLALVIFAFASFSLEKIPTDLTAFLVFANLVAASAFTGTERLPEMADILRVFANPAPVTIAAMFILSAALDKCGAIDSMARMISRTKSLPYPVLILFLVVLVAFVSAFVNNTPVVVVLLPVMLSLARQSGISASKLLIPLSYASILGGTCTLIGTSTNILASGIIKDAGLEPISMFELSRIGLPLLACGAIYLAFLGNRLLPDRETLTQILSPEERKEYITEAFVQQDSPIVGKMIKETNLQRASGVRILEIIREGVAVPGNPKVTALRGGDRLVLACRPHGMAEARSLAGVDFVGEAGLGLEQIAAQEGAIVEGVIGPKSTIVGKTIPEINFRQRFRMIIVAIHREGRNVREQLETLQLQFGDTLLMMGTDRAIENMRNSDDVLLLDQPREQASSFRKKLPIVLGVLVGVVLLNSFGIVPIEASVFMGVAVLFATNCIRPKEAYASIDWSILILIFGMLALGLAMQTSGATLLIADLLQGLSENPLLLLAALYLATTVLTETLSNNATIVLMAPIALELANQLGVDPRPFIITCCIASSASFSTPIGYQTNTYVYSVGGYRFSDFAKVGLGLNFICFTISILLIPRLWSF